MSLPSGRIKWLAAVAAGLEIWIRCVRGPTVTIERSAMSSPPDRLVGVVGSAEAVLLDFDGPVCSLFAGKKALDIAASVRLLLGDELMGLPGGLADEDDPLELLRLTSQIAPALTADVEAVVRSAEVEAAGSAETTIGLFDVVRVCMNTGRAVGIVSDNSIAAVNAYLERRDRARYFDVIIGRGDHPGLMKPSPYPIIQALQALDVQPEAAVLVGDAAADVEAAHRAGVTSIGYANRPGKTERLAAAGADAIVTYMSDLAGALAETRQLRSRLPWIESAGGPLIVVPTAVLPSWRGGFDALSHGDPTRGDYGRACEIGGYAGVIPVGGAQALVLGDDPAPTTYLPDQRLFVRWVYADSEDEVIRPIPQVIREAVWEDAGSWVVNGPAVMFDAALPGDALEPGDQLSIQIEPGTYQVRTAYLKIDQRYRAFALVQLAAS